jgi:hypothetical protein
VKTATLQLGDGSSATNSNTLQIGNVTCTGTQLNNLLTNTAGYLTSATLPSTLLTTSGGQTSTGTLTLSDTSYNNTRLTINFTAQSGSGNSSQDYIQIGAGSYGGLLGGGLTQSTGGFVSLSVNNAAITEVLRAYSDNMKVNVPIALNYTTAPTTGQLGYMTTTKSNLVTFNITSATTYYYNALTQTAGSSTNACTTLTGSVKVQTTSSCLVTGGFGLNVTSPNTGYATSPLDTDGFGVMQLVGSSTYATLLTLTKTVYLSTSKDYTMWVGCSVANNSYVNAGDTYFKATRIA